MKLLIQSVLLILFFNSCAAQNDTNLTLNYEAHTRGSSVIIKVISKELTFSNFEGEKKYLVTPENWKSIQNSIDKIDLNTIKNLEAPSTKSHTDAALIASLKVTKGGKTYDSVSFDHGNPPKELKELVDLLFSITEKK